MNCVIKKIITRIKWEYMGKFFSISILLFSSIYLGKVRRIAYLFLLLCIGFLGISEIAARKKKKYSILFQESVLFFLIGILVLVFLLLAHGSYANTGGVLYALITFGFALLFFSIWNLIFLLKNINFLNLIKKKLDFRKNVVILSLLLICFILGMCVLPVQVRWDSASITHQVYENTPNNLFVFRDYQGVGYTSQFFFNILGMFGYIVRWNEIGLSIPSIMLYLASIVSIYRIIGKIAPNNSNFSKTIMTSIYAFSPFVLGMIGNRTNDLWLVYFFPMIVCSYLHKEWINFAFICIISCFTKQTIIIELFGFFVGLILVDLFIKKRKFKEMLFEKKWYLMLFIGLFWLIGFSNISAEGPAHSFFDFPRIINVLKIFFILNFNWIFSVTILFFVIFSIIKKNYDWLCFSFPLLLGNLFFLIFNIVYSTASNPRYVDSFISCKYILVISGMAYFMSNHIRNIIAGCISLLMLLSVWLTIDPISKLVFKTYNMGSGEMLTADNNECIGDAMVYNAQWKYFDIALNEAMKKCVKDEAVIIFPQWQKGVVYNFEGKYDGEYMAYETINNWDEKNVNRTVLQFENSKKIKILNIYDYEQLLGIDGLDGAYFFSIPSFGNKISEKLVEDGMAEEQQYFIAGPFQIVRTKITLRHTN